MTDTLRSTDAKGTVPRVAGGRQIVCWGSAGSGKSAISVNLAAELVDLGQRVLLVDADSYHPSLAAMLGVVDPGPGITAVLRLVRSERFDFDELTRLGHKIELERKSMWLITGMNNPARWPELDANSLAALAAFAAQSFDFVVWDVAAELETGVVGGQFGEERNIAGATLVGLADEVIGLFSADPVGINRFLFDVRCVGRDFIPIANRVRSSVLGRQPERQLRDALFQLARINLLHEIPEDPGFDEMLKSIRPLSLQGNRSKAREVVRQLAQQLIDFPTD